MLCTLDSYGGTVPKSYGRLRSAVSLAPYALTCISHRALSVHFVECKHFPVLSCFAGARAGEVKFWLDTPGQAHAHTSLSSDCVILRMFPPVAVTTRADRWVMFVFMYVCHTGTHTACVCRVCVLCCQQQDALSRRTQKCILLCERAQATRDALLFRQINVPVCM